MTMDVKCEKLTRADHFRHTLVCANAFCKQLNCNISNIASTTNHAHKRSQRNLVMDKIDTVLAILPPQMWQM